MKLRVLAVLGAVGVLASACGGGSDSTDPAAFGDVDDDTQGQTCEQVKLTTPGITLTVGTQKLRVPALKDPEVCVNYDAQVAGVPVITAQPDCGTPCYTVELSSIKAYADVSVVLKYQADDQEITVGPVTPGPIDVGQRVDRVCFAISPSSEDLCNEVPTPAKDLTALQARKKLGVIKLSWTASRDRQGGALTYHINRSDTGEEGSFVEITTTTQTIFTDIDLVSGQTYYYQVVTSDADDHRSAPSDTASAAAK